MKNSFTEMEETSPDFFEIRILAVCATYNRREVTLAGLRSLHNQLLPANTTIQLALVDDNSEDGTIDAVRQEFPAVLTLKSSGGLYWAGAMRLGFSTFWNPVIYTHLLVFNDDCNFYPNATATLLEAYKSHTTAMRSNSGRGVVIVGSFHDGIQYEPTYGGFIQQTSLKPVKLIVAKPTGKSQYVDTLNMNLALIDKDCLSRHSLIEDYFTHSYADIDFGLRVHRHGVPIILAPNYQGICYRNTTANTWQDPNIKFAKRLRLMLGPKGVPFQPRYHFLRRYAPTTWPIFLFWPYLKLTMSHFVSLFVGVLAKRNVRKK